MTNPKALLAEEVQSLFREALEKTILAPGGFEEVAEDIVHLIETPGAYVLIGEENNELKALSITVLPESKIQPWPQVLHIFNKGSPKMRDMIIKGTVDFVKEKGYDRFWAVNGSGKSDVVWAHTFRKAGKSTKIGSILEFQITDERDIKDSVRRQRHQVNKHANRRGSARTARTKRAIR